MKILFDLRRTGLGNNGGSLTLIKSANTLQDLGEEVFIIDDQENKHTWNELKVPHLICKKEKQIPDADVIIATGYNSVKTTVESHKRCGIKFHWIRGWETWQGDENWILLNVLKQPTIKLVNSICLQKKLEQFHIKSHIIRPGYDFNELYPIEDEYRKHYDYFIIGGLYTKGKHEQIKRTRWVFEAFVYLKRKYKNIQLWMLGEPQIPHNLIDRYYRRPTIDEKFIFYNSVSLWLAPVQQEGLHMPPAEAMLCECPVVGTNAEMSGMQDYLIDGYTGLVSENNLDDFIECAEKLYKSNSLRKEYGINAYNKIKELGDRKDNMKRLINLLMENI